MSRPLWFSQPITNRITILQTKQQVVCILADTEANIKASEFNLLCVRDPLTDLQDSTYRIVPTDYMNLWLTQKGTIH